MTSLLNYRPRKCFECMSEVTNDSEGDWICAKCHIAWRMVRQFADLEGLLQ